MKNFLKSAILVLTIVLLYSCSNDDDEPTFALHEATITNPEDYDVYSKIINSGYDTNLVLNQLATKGSPSITDEYIIQDLVDNNPGFETSMVETLINLDDSYLGNNFNCDPIIIHLTSPEELNYIFNNQNEFEENWLNFFEHYNNNNLIGLYQFSRVAYNNDHSKALVELSQMYGPLFGYGYVFYLEKENGNWVIKDTIEAWVS